MKVCDAAATPVAAVTLVRGMGSVDLGSSGFKSLLPVEVLGKCKQMFVNSCDLSKKIGDALLRLKLFAIIA